MTIIQTEYIPEREQDVDAHDAYSRLTRVRAARPVQRNTLPWSMYVEHAMTREEYGRLTGRW